MNQVTVKEAAKRANESIQKIMEVALEAVSDAEKGMGACALQIFRERHPDELANEAGRFLDELSASIVLVGGSRMDEDQLANLTIGELLAMAIPNKINFRVWPSESQFHK